MIVIRHIRHISLSITDFRTKINSKITYFLLPYNRKQNVLSASLNFLSSFLRIICLVLISHYSSKLPYKPQKPSTAIIKFVRSQYLFVLTDFRSKRKHTLHYFGPKYKDGEPMVEVSETVGPTAVCNL